VIATTRGLGRKRISAVLTETKKMVENAEAVRWSLAADEELEKKRNPLYYGTKLNRTAFRFVPSSMMK
jgi:hypothetical protein